MIEYSQVRRVHFVGIGGAGMSGIAEVLHNMGFSVSGSDQVSGDAVRRLKQLGIRVAIGHQRQNIGQAECLVYSSAVRPINVEVQEALKRKIPVISRAEMLAELMRLKFSIVIAGTHGKTTTTSMIASILNGADFDPTFVVGGKVKMAGSGAKLGFSRYLVAEADESDGSFLRLFPVVAVITNIDNDHLDHYHNLNKLQKAFLEFANKVPFYGLVIVNLDSPPIGRIYPLINKKLVSYSIKNRADFRATDLVTSPFKSSYRLEIAGKNKGRIELGVGGIHNVSNSLAAIAAAIQVGVPLRLIKEVLKRFSLPERRFQVLFSSDHCTVVDDYAHHPSEIKATLAMARSGSFRRIVAVFQPHRYTRLRLLLNQFSRAFNQADWVLIAPLYAASESPIKNMGGKILARKILESGHRRVRYLESFPKIGKFLGSEMREGDAVIFLSAGNLSQFAQAFAAGLKERAQ